MNKKGQFYLIAAVFISLLILGFFAFQNLVEKKPNTILYDLEEELDFEGTEVLQLEVLSGNDDLTEELAEQYSKYAGETNRTIYFLIGDQKSVSLIAYEEVIIGSLTINLGETSASELITKNVIVTSNFQGNEGKVIVKIKGIDYEFDLKEGQNFFFVISQEIEGETHVVTN